MTIESVTLKNFQCHRSLTVEFDPHVTCITGVSDVGKSAVLRAVRWALTNRPDGTAMVRHGAGSARVLLSLDGRTLRRLRGEGVNTYVLDDNTPLKAVGRCGVPKAIADLANVGGVNFQSQLDGPYWFLLSPPEVSRQLNGIINLGSIDDALANAAQEVRRSNTAVSVSEERLRDARTRREGLKWAVAFDRDLSAVETLERRLSDHRARTTGLRRTLEDVAGWVQTLRTRSAAVLDAKKAVEAGSKLVEFSTRTNRLRSLIFEITEKRETVNRRVPDLGTIKGVWDRYQTVKRRRSRLSSLWLNVSQLQHTVEFADMQLYDARRQIKKITRGRCPICKRPFPSRSTSATSTPR